jgi:hypothetical protein
MRRKHNYQMPRGRSCKSLAFVVCGALSLASCSVAVKTYHYDNSRTGWNHQEKILNYSNVNSTSLVKLSLSLDDQTDQVEAQPLIVPHIKVAGGKHDVVYVATENNNIYAIDAKTDAKLFKVNLGTAVTAPCGTSTPTVGINSTPVIDPNSKTMYVIAYVSDGNGSAPQYFVHALDLTTLADKVTPQLVKASNGTYTFDAAHQRQRPGLLLAGGNLYAGFGSFCDTGGILSRGWVLGWKANSLTPLAANELNNTLTSEPNGMFLASVWMSGYALAGDAKGSVYFTTGNSDIANTNNECTDISESVVKLNPDLARPWPCPPPTNGPPNKGLFTPSNVGFLESNDDDVGSAGVMTLPRQSGHYHNLAVANAKSGQMFLLDRDDMGGNHRGSQACTPSNSCALDTEDMGNDGPGNGWSSGDGCWCGPSYFNDGTPHVVSSGGTFAAGFNQNLLALWTLQTGPSPKLVRVASASMPNTVQDIGFFTAVSSNGRSQPIIWAISRPVYNDGNPVIPYIWLYAFKATPSGNTLPQLVQAIAGSWSPYGSTNATIVPVVANGKVYVASDRELDIFGIGLPGGSKLDSVCAIPVSSEPEFPNRLAEHQVTGIVRKVDGPRLAVETRDHKTVYLDTTKAREALRYPPVFVGATMVAAGSYDANGVLQAAVVWRAKNSPSAWLPDR